MTKLLLKVTGPAASENSRTGYGHYTESSGDPKVINKLTSGFPISFKKNNVVRARLMGVYDRTLSEANRDFDFGCTLWDGNNTESINLNDYTSSIIPPFIGISFNEENQIGNTFNLSHNVSNISYLAGTSEPEYSGTGYAMLSGDIFQGEFCKAVISNVEYDGGNSPLLIKDGQINTVYFLVESSEIDEFTYTDSYNQEVSVNLTSGPVVTGGLNIEVLYVTRYSKGLILEPGSINHIRTSSMTQSSPDTPVYDSLKLLGQPCFSTIAANSNVSLHGIGFSRTSLLNIGNEYTSTYYVSSIGNIVGIDGTGYPAGNIEFDLVNETIVNPTSNLASMSKVSGNIYKLEIRFTATSGNFWANVRTYDTLGALTTSYAAGSEILKVLAQLEPGLLSTSYILPGESDSSRQVSRIAVDSGVVVSKAPSTSVSIFMSAIWGDDLINQPLESKILALNGEVLSAQELYLRWTSTGLSLGSFTFNGRLDAPVPSTGNIGKDERFTVALTYSLDDQLIKCSFNGGEVVSVAYYNGGPYVDPNDTPQLALSHIHATSPAKVIVERYESRPVYLEDTELREWT